MATRTIEVRGIEFGTVSEAVQHMDASGFGDQIVSVAGRKFLVAKAEADRLDTLGVVSAFWYDVDGRIMSVPVN